MALRVWPVEQRSAWASYRPRHLPAMSWILSPCYFVTDCYISLGVLDTTSPGLGTAFDSRHWTVAAYPWMPDFDAVMIDPL